MSRPEGGDRKKSIIRESVWLPPASPSVSDLPTRCCYSAVLVSLHTLQGELVSEFFFSLPACVALPRATFVRDLLVASCVLLHLQSASPPVSEPAQGTSNALTKKILQQGDAIEGSRLYLAFVSYLPQ